MNLANLSVALGGSNYSVIKATGIDDLDSYSNTPYTQFGNETLNANVHWYMIARELLAHYTQEQLASETEITRTTLFKVLNQDYSKLTFKMGARLLGVHGRFYPESVC